MSTSALLFDLGNVVVGIDFERVLAAWAPHSRLPLEGLRERFSHDAAYEAHETGHLSAEGYFAHLRELLHLACGDDEISEGWNAIFTEPVAPTVALVDEVRRRVPCYVLSNTNATHIATCVKRFPGLMDRFERPFYSHEIGHRKPQADCFAHALREMNVPAGEVLFFDDLQANVDAALVLGLQAALVTSPQDVKRELAARGLLDPS